MAEPCHSAFLTLLKKKDISLITKLTETIKKLWTHELTVDYLQNLSDSLPRRLQIMIDSKRETKKY
jgi:hypothetical protein